MPIMQIKVPAPVAFTNPDNGEPIADAGAVTFNTIVSALLNRNKWTASIAMIESSQAIRTAVKEAKDGVILLAEEDWKHLKEAAELPKCLVRTETGQLAEQDGLGYHPTVTPQLLPLLHAITKADKAAA